nr:hypothetical protein CFP56_44316 [Quercus suber]
MARRPMVRELRTANQMRGSVVDLCRTCPPEALGADAGRQLFGCDYNISFCMIPVIYMMMSLHEPEPSPHPDAKCFRVPRRRYSSYDGVYHSGMLEHWHVTYANDELRSNLKKTGARGLRNMAWRVCTPEVGISRRMKPVMVDQRVRDFS